MNANIVILFLLPLLFSPNGGIVRVAEGGKRRIHITDDLDDVVDDEEDEEWKQWGKKSTSSSLDEFDPPPSDLSNMDIKEMQEIMMKRNFGPVFGFVKLRLGVRRTGDMVAEIATRWAKVLRTGAMEVKFSGFDLSTIMFNMENGRNAMELKEFILSQPEAYEIKIGDQVYQRLGDPPLEELIRKLESEKERVEDDVDTKDSVLPKEEL